MGKGLIGVRVLNSVVLGLHKCNGGESCNKNMKSKKQPLRACEEVQSVYCGPCCGVGGGSTAVPGGWMSWRPWIVAFMSQRTSVFGKAKVNSPKLKAYRAKHNFLLKRK